MCLTCGNECNWQGTAYCGKCWKKMEAAYDLFEALKKALEHVHEHSDGCLYCGEGDIVDGGITEEHRKDCWYYKAKATIAKAEGKVVD